MLQSCEHDQACRSQAAVHGLMPGNGSVPCKAVKQQNRGLAGHQARERGRSAAGPLKLILAHTVDGLSRMLLQMTSCSYLGGGGRGHQ